MLVGMLEWIGTDSDGVGVVDGLLEGAWWESFGWPFPFDAIIEVSDLAIDAVEEDESPSDNRLFVPADPSGSRALSVCARLLIFNLSFSASTSMMLTPFITRTVPS